MTAKNPTAQMGLCFDDPTDGWVCGVDEAGRGPLAGPVFAAAVILPPEHGIIGLADSKVLSAKKRETLFTQIQNRSVAWCIAEASVEEIDRLNILQATMLAMKRAVEGLQTPLGLPVTPVLALIDGNRCPMMSVRSEAIVKGDAKVPAISAASILAKVARDRCLLALHEHYPQYGFSQHSGYPTALHLAALEKHGASPHHRKSFGPVRKVLANAEQI